MQRKTSFLKRFTALALALMLLVSMADLGSVLHVFAAEPAQKTVGTVVAENYNLTDAEKALLKSGALADRTVTYAKPNSDDGLITVDTDNKKIEAKTKNGYAAVVAAIIVNGSVHETVKLTDGKGTYNYDGNAFSVKVTYENRQEFTAEEQQALLNAMAWLKQGIANIDTVSEQSSNLSALELAMPKLVELAANDVALPNDKTAGVSDEAKAAITALNNEMGSNGGVLKLTSDINAYSEGAKTEYLLVNGTTMLFDVIALSEEVTVISAELVKLADNLETFVEYGFVDEETAEQIRMLSDIMGNLDDGLKAIPTDWTAAEKGTALVASGVNYAALDVLVAALGTVSSVTIKTSLLVDTTEIQHNLSMYDVTIKVVLNTVQENNEVKKFGEETTVVTLMKDATKNEILAAVEETGLVAGALSAWAPTYVDGKFDVETTELPATLTKDIEYVITYSPKNYVVTYKYETTETETVPYGYKLTLPAHEDPLKAYDYKVNGVSFAQGVEITVEDTTEIERKAGKAYYSTNLYTIVADNYGDDIAKAILKSGAVKGNEAVNVRKPDPADAANLLTLIGGKVTGAKYDAAYNELFWAPYTYGETGVENKFSGETANWAGDSVQVQYKLDLTNYTVAEVQAILDLAADLKAEADAQKSTLDSFASYHETMGQLDKTKLGALNGVIDVTDFTPGDGTDTDAENKEMQAYFKATVSAIIGGHLGSNNKLVIYNMLTEYKNDGLRYYYGNSAAVINEINALAGYLGDMIKEEEALKIMVTAAGYPEYAEKIADLEGALANVQQNLTVPNAAIDLKSASLGKLLDALTVSGTVANQTAGNPYLISDTLTVQDSSLVMIQVGVEINGESKYFTIKELEVGTEITKAMIDGLKAEIAAFTGDVTHYDLTVDGETLESLIGTEINANFNTVYTYTVKTYNVTIDGAEHETVSLNDLEINLPKHPVDDFRYEYTIDGVTGITTSTYTFTVDQLTKLFKSGTYNITRVEIDEAEEKFDETFGDWIVEDEEGNVVALEAKVDGNKDGIMGFAMTIVNSGYTYVGLNNEPLLYMNAENTLEIRLQTLINALLNDEGFSSDRMITLGKDGKGVFLKTKMDIGNTSDTPARARSGGVDYLYSDLDFTLYLTSVPGAMGTVSKGLEKVKPYMSFHAGDGLMNIDLNLPEKVYEVYLTALLATGHVDKTDMDAVNSEIAFQFLWDYVETIMATEANTTTYTNTLKKLGQTYDLTGAEEYYQLLKKALTNPGVVVNPEDENEDVDISITAKSQDAINGLIDMIGFDISAYETYLGMILEYKDPDAEIFVAGRATLGNTNKGFEAALVDLNASGVTNKFDYTDDLIGRAKSIANNAAIILLKDIEKNEDLVINGTTILDLNGKSMKGGITVKNGTLYIVDSTLNTAKAGLVEGRITGNAKIFAGNYNEAVTSLLSDGYVQENGYVRNRLYTLDTDNDKNTTVSVSTDLLKNRDVDYVSFAKALAVDVAVDLVLNHYTSAALSVEAAQQTRSLEYHDLYNINIDDLIALLESSNKKADLVQKVIDSINIGEFDGLINDIIADMLDFAAIKAAAENDKALVTYKMAAHPFMVSVEHETANGEDYIEFGITSNEKISKNFSVSLKAADAEDREYLAKIADALDVVVDDATSVTITIDEIENKYIETRGIEIPVVNGGASVKIIVDLTKETRWNYAEKLADALGVANVDALKASIDAATAEKVIEKLSGYVDGSSKPEKAATYALNTLGKLLSKLGVEDKPFGDFETEYGKYVLSGKAHRENAFRGVFENLDVDVYVEIKMFKEDTECEHEWGEWVVTQEPTCTEDGTVERTCKKCGEVETHAAPATGHTEEDVPGYAATCTEDGLTDGVVCSVCGCVIVPQEVIPALGHDFEATVTEPTCTEKGYTTYTCTRCGYSYVGNYVDEVPHIDDNHDHACDVCGEKISECVDEDPKDGYCDICGRFMCDCAVDEDHDHFCDICGERLSWCHDCDRDHLCDICGKTLTPCIDRNHNHICDICGAVLGDCEDKNNDHLCDYCFRIVSLCKDENKDHNCDLCGRKISCCIDTNRDGYCDICGVELDWVIRLSGATRAATAREAAEELKAILGVKKFDTMVYASGYNFPDALAGTYFANQMEAPILMYFHEEIAMNLLYIKQNLSVGGTVYILGGTEAVPAYVEIGLKEAGINVERLGGETRFETNLEILDETGFDGGETVLVCTGYEFADSLSASATGMPILLVNNSYTELRESQVAYLESLSEKCNFILIGGTDAISSELEEVITAYDADGKVERVGGLTRFETSLMVAEKFFPNADQAVLAYGWMFPDALCGGTVGYALGAPVVLASDAKINAVAEYITKHSMDSGYVMGGTVRLTDEVVVKAFDLDSADQIHTR